MIDSGINEDYFYWLLAFIDSYENPVDDYIDCLHELFTITYTWTIPDDANRAEDGLSLRDRFEDESGEKLWLNRGCSMLEMMVALAIRMENDLMYDPDYGDRTSVWFWGMMDASGLIFCDFDHFSGPLVQKWSINLAHNDYKRNGVGGLFSVKNAHFDMKNASLWAQMNQKVKEMVKIS